MATSRRPPRRGVGQDFAVPLYLAFTRIYSALRRLFWRKERKRTARFEVAVPPSKRSQQPRFDRCRVADEVEVVFYKRASSFSCAAKPKRAFACWFHTHFVENGVLTLAKHELDKACKDKKASPDLSVSISFRPPPKAREASNRTPSPNNVVP